MFIDSKSIARLALPAAAGSKTRVVAGLLDYLDASATYDLADEILLLIADSRARHVALGDDVLADHVVDALGYLASIEPDDEGPDRFYDTVEQWRASRAGVVGLDVPRLSGAISTVRTVGYLHDINVVAPFVRPTSEHISDDGWTVRLHRHRDAPALAVTDPTGVSVLTAPRVGGTLTAADLDAVCEGLGGFAYTKVRGRDEALAAAWRSAKALHNDAMSAAPAEKATTSSVWDLDGRAYEPPTA